MFLIISKATLSFNRFFSIRLIKFLVLIIIITITYKLLIFILNKLLEFYIKITLILYYIFTI